MTIKVVIAKPGVDGHDVGAKVVCRALRDAGMDVLYTGLRKSPAEIAKAAREHQADVVGLSIMSGAHVGLCEKIAAALKEAGVASRLVVGGVIPAKDKAALEAAGASAVFGVGSSLDDIVRWIEAHAQPGGAPASPKGAKA